MIVTVSWCIRRHRPSTLFWYIFHPSAVRTGQIYWVVPCSSGREQQQQKVELNLKREREYHIYELIGILLRICDDRIPFAADIDDKVSLIKSANFDFLRIEFKQCAIWRRFHFTEWHYFVARNQSRGYHAGYSCFYFINAFSEIHISRARCLATDLALKIFPRRGIIASKPKAYAP